jgi:peptide-methionine (S)-S-oxide reductase
MTITRSTFGLGLTLALLAQFAFTPPAAFAAEPVPATGLRQIVLAGGCFWGMELVFDNVIGVKEALPGYSGGDPNTAHYDLVSTGTTRHAESVRITYDPSEVSLDQLLTVYFTVAHDPTQLNRQSPDEGPQYRSAIFVANGEQRAAAKAMIAKLSAEHRFSSPIVTKLEPLSHFFPAEDYHVKYAVLHPNEPYIAYIELPRLAALKSTYPRLVAHKKLG